MSESAETRIDTLTKALYRVMPGAEMPASVDGYYLWGEIEHTDHWVFCQTIAMNIVVLTDRAKGEAG